MNFCPPSTITLGPKPKLIGPMIMGKDFYKNIVKKIERPKVSFDFDGTLERPFTQLYARWLLSIGVEVHVVTSRYESWEAAPQSHKLKFQQLYPAEIELNFNKDLFDVVNKVGITDVHFTNFDDKANFFDTMRDVFLFHLDDANFEVASINRNQSVLPIMIKGSWIDKCNRILKKNGWFPVAPNEVILGEHLWYYNKVRNGRGTSFKRGIVKVVDLESDYIKIEDENGNVIRTTYSNQEVGLPVKTWEFFNLMKIDALPF